MYNFKEVMNKPEWLAPGHRMCAGCGGTVAVRTVLRAVEEGDKAVIGNSTGCWEVSSFMYPYTAYEDKMKGVMDGELFALLSNQFKERDQQKEA